MATATILTTCCLATVASFCLMWSAPAAAYVAPCVVDCLLRSSKSEDECYDWCRAVQVLEYLQGHPQGRGQGQGQSEEEELRLLSEDYDRPPQGEVVEPNKWVRIGRGIEKRVRGFVRIGRLTTRPDRSLQHSRAKRNLADDNSQSLAGNNATDDVNKRAKSFIRIGRDGADSNIESKLQAMASATDSIDPLPKKRRSFIRIGRENGYSADKVTNEDVIEDQEENIAEEEEKDKGEEKRARNFVRIGRNGEQGSIDDESAEFFSTHSNGKRARNFVRIGRSADGKRARNFVRIGRAKSFVRIGRGSQTAIIERDTEMEKRARNFVRIGRQLALIDGQLHNEEKREIKRGASAQFYRSG